MKGFLLVLVVLFGSYYLWTLTDSYDYAEGRITEEVYCAGFKGRVVKDLPAECLHYFTTLQPATSTPDKTEWLKWNCTVVLDCPRVDWRYSRPQDVCTYQKQIIMSPTNPVELEAYGGECTQMQ